MSSSSSASASASVSSPPSSPQHFAEIVKNEENAQIDSKIIREQEVRQLLRAGAHHMKRQRKIETYLQKEREALNRIKEQLRENDAFKGRAEYHNVIFKLIKRTPPRKQINGRTLPAILEELIADREESKKLSLSILHHESLVNPPIERVDIQFREINEKKEEAKRKWLVGKKEKEEGEGDD